MNLLFLALLVWAPLVHAYIVAPQSRLSSISTKRFSNHAENAILPLKPEFALQIASNFKSAIDKLTEAFPLFVLAGSILGYKRPSYLTWFTPYVTPALSLTMLSMGMNLTLDDFKRVLKEPKYIAMGFMAQYTIMPLAAYNIARIARLGPSLSAGLILVGCAPGGVASNLVSLIAQADVALSVVMTACSTVAGNNYQQYSIYS